MLNWLFYFPLQFVGIWMWMKHRKSKEEAERGEDVFVNRLSKKGWLIVLGSFVVGAFIYAELLTLLSAQQVRIDSMAVVLSRSEEHTSELQSRGHLVCRLLLEKKNKSREHMMT